MFYPFSYFRFDPTMIILIPAVILTLSFVYDINISTNENSIF